MPDLVAHRNCVDDGEIIVFINVSDDLPSNVLGFETARQIVDCGDAIAHDLVGHEPKRGQGLIKIAGDQVTHVPIGLWRTNLLQVSTAGMIEVDQMREEVDEQKRQD